MGGTCPTLLPTQAWPTGRIAKPGSILCIEGQQDVRPRESSRPSFFSSRLLVWLPQLHEYGDTTGSPEGGDRSLSGEPRQAQPTEQPNPPGPT
jgi:hypothetical protein